MPLTSIQAKARGLFQSSGIPETGRWRTSEVTVPSSRPPEVPQHQQRTQRCPKAAGGEAWGPEEGQAPGHSVSATQASAMTVTTAAGLDDVVVYTTVTFTSFSVKPGASSLGPLQWTPLHTPTQANGGERKTAPGTPSSRPPAPAVPDWPLETSSPPNGAHTVTQASSVVPILPGSGLSLLPFHGSHQVKEGRAEGTLLFYGGGN